MVRESPLFPVIADAAFATPLKLVQGKGNEPDTLLSKVTCAQASCQISVSNCSSSCICPCHIYCTSPQHFSILIPAQVQLVLVSSVALLSQQELNFLVPLNSPRANLSGAHAFCLLRPLLSLFVGSNLILPYSKGPTPVLHHSAGSARDGLQSISIPSWRSLSSVPVERLPRFIPKSKDRHCACSTIRPTRPY